MSKLWAIFTVAVDFIHDNWRRPLHKSDITTPLYDIAKAIVLGIVAGTYLAVLIYAKVLFDETLTWAGILTIGGFATVLLIFQVFGWAIFQPKSWSWKIKCSKLQTATATLIVGIATHYAAIMIGVSFATVFSEDGDTWSIVAVGIQQVVLTSASWLLVNAYRRSNTVGPDLTPKAEAHWWATQKAGGSNAVGRDLTTKEDKQIPVLIAFPVAIWLWLTAARLANDSICASINTLDHPGYIKAIEKFLLACFI